MRILSDRLLQIGGGGGALKAAGFELRLGGARATQVSENDTLTVHMVGDAEGHQAFDGLPVSIQKDDVEVSTLTSADLRAGAGVSLSGLASGSTHILTALRGTVSSQTVTLAVMGLVPVRDLRTTMIPGALPDAVAEFDDLTGWSFDPSVVVTDGEVHFDGTQTSHSYATRSSLGTTDENAWVVFDQHLGTSGSIRADLTVPLSQGSTTTNREHETVEKFTRGTSTGLRLRMHSAYNGRIKAAQIVPMDAALARPARVFIAAGQSLMAAGTSGLGLDVAKGDRWQSDRCLYAPGADSPQFSLTAGEIYASVPPLQNNGGNALGLTPAHAFQGAILDHIPDTDNIVILHVAAGGTSLLGDTAEWNPSAMTAPGATLYNNMIARAQALLASLPAGSTIEGILWSQGQSDNNEAITSNYPPALQVMLNQARTDLGLPDLPMIIFGPNADAPVWDNLGAAQASLDVDSGSEFATAGVYYVPGLPGYDEDGTHINADGSRAHGVAAAREWVSRVLSAPSSANAMTYGGEPVTYGGEPVTN